MTVIDALTYLSEAHTRAEHVAKAATRGPWTFNGNPSCVVTAEPYAQSVASAYNHAPEVNSANARHIALHDPAAVLDRICNERRLLARHSPMAGEAYGGGSTVCKECATHRPGKISEGVPYPCATVRMLARAWGWERPSSYESVEPGCSEQSEPSDVSDLLPISPSVYVSSVPGVQLIVDCIGSGVYTVEAINHAVLRSSGVRYAGVSDLVSVADQAMADAEGSA